MPRMTAVFREPQPARGSAGEPGRRRSRMTGQRRAQMPGAPAVPVTRSVSDGRAVFRGRNDIVAGRPQVEDRATVRRMSRRIPALTILAAPDAPVVGARPEMSVNERKRAYGGTRDTGPPPRRARVVRDQDAAFGADQPRRGLVGMHENGVGEPFIDAERVGVMRPADRPQIVVAAGGDAVRRSRDHTRRSFDRSDGHDLGERFVLQLLPAVRLVGLVGIVRPLPETAAPARARHQAARFPDQAGDAVLLGTDARPGSTDGAVVYALGSDEPVIAGDSSQLKLRI